MYSFGLLFIAGILGGLLSGLLGIGGGIIYVFIIPPALSYFGIPVEEMAQYTIANSILAIFFGSLAANYAFYRNKEFYVKEVLLISLASIPVSIITLDFLVDTHVYSTKIFNAIFIVLMIYVFFITLRTEDSAPENEKSGTITSYLITGLSGGAIASLSGLGGGIIIIPLLTLWRRINIKKASAISSGVIMITSFVMSIFNISETPRHQYHTFSMGYIIFPISFTLALSVIFASPAGVKLRNILSAATIRYIYSFFLMFVIIKKGAELYHQWL